MTPETQRLIDRLEKGARNAASATNAAQREAARTFMVRRERELFVTWEAMEQKLGRQLDWLDASDDPRADAETRDRFARREEQFLALLDDYVAIGRARDRALATWLGEGAA